MGPAGEGECGLWNARPGPAGSQRPSGHLVGVAGRPPGLQVVEGAGPQAQHGRFWKGAPARLLGAEEDGPSGQLGLPGGLSFAVMMENGQPVPEGQQEGHQPPPPAAGRGWLPWPQQPHQPE